MSGADAAGAAAADAVRFATVTDAAAIAGVHVRAWHRGYPSLLPAALLEAITPSLREPQWRARLSGASGEQVETLVAVGPPGAPAAAPPGAPAAAPPGAPPAALVVVGFCCFSTPSRDPDATPATAELAALYVDPSRWGGGVADSLVAALLTQLAADAGRWHELTLWMLDGNARAGAFYARHGFAADGARRTDTLSGPAGLRVPAPHVRLRRRLG